MNDPNDIINVFIVAASPIVRAGLEAVVRSDERFSVAGGAAETSAAPFAFPHGRKIDVLLMNVERRNEFDSLKEFLDGAGGAETNAPLVVALLSADFQNAASTTELLRGGARGILTSEATGEEIGAAIAAAANDLIVAPPEILETLLSLTADENFPLLELKRMPDAAFESLTAREREVLELLVEGASNKIIAYRLNISEHTVKFHVASIFGKLGVNSRTEAVTIALRRGLILL